MNTLTLSQRLAREVRAEAARQNLTQSTLAERAGVNRVTLRRYFFTEERDAPMDAVFLVAKALGMSAGSLVQRAEDADPIALGGFGDYDLAADVDPDAKADED